MRRTLIPVASVTVFALIAPALGALETRPSSPSPSPPVQAQAAEQALRRLGAMRPPIAPRMGPAGVATHAAGAPSPSPARGAGGGGVPAAGTAPATRTYVVESGDTLWSISRAHGVSVESLASANGAALTSVLALGRTLLIPPEGVTPAPSASTTVTRPGSTVTHTVRSGETLWEIARRYNARVEDLMALNDLGHSEWIKPGQRLVVSGRAIPRHRQVAAQSRSGRPSTGARSERARVEIAGGFLWPARGVLTSRYGWRYRRHHDGIDLASPRGTPIYAARDGLVEFAGWNGGYGRVVYLNHGGGLVTVYGHASSLLVSPGERVTKGQVIARVGCTGVCTGSHLHFEVRVNGRAVNPLRYLR